MASDDLETMYQQYRKEEQDSKNVLLDFEKLYPGVTTEDNIADILKAAKARKRQSDK